MQNRAMEAKLAKGEAIDVSKWERTPDGDYRMPKGQEFVADVDYCDAELEAWIWSIGELADGSVVASTASKFYQAAGVECLWLR